MITQQAGLYAGLMSGTSLDGIDAVLVDLDGGAPRLLASHYTPYSSRLKTVLLALHQAGRDELHQAYLTANELAREYAGTVNAMLQTASIPAARVRAVGCHGQTLRHRPDAGYTVQLGNAALLAELTGITIVSDFRSRDMAAGGQGAPLVPAFHDRVMRHPSLHRVIVNIGGISNLTSLPPGQPVTGFDCGPGNLLMDAWIALHRGEPYDRDGAWAAGGGIISPLLQCLLDEPFIRALPPKSSGRDLFNLEWLSGKLNGTEMPQDVQTTLLEYTCRAISDAILRHCAGAAEIYLCGGGVHNLALVRRLRDLLPDRSVMITNSLGVDADWVEAMAFAWLAQQTVSGISANLPAVTGARHACILGAIYPA